MVAAFVQEVAAYTTGTSGNPDVVAIAVAPSIGNHLVVIAIKAGGRTLTGVTDSQGNTWQIDETLLNTTNHGIGIASCRVVNPLTTSDTISLTWSSTGVAAAVVNEYSGLDPTAWVDKSVSSVQVSQTPVESGLTGTTAQADELLVGAVAHAGTSTHTPDVVSPVWNTRGTQASSGTVRTIRSYDRVVAAAGDYEFAGDLSGAQVNTGAIVTYKAAAGGGGGGGVRLDARWLNFAARGQAWTHFWQDTPLVGDQDKFATDSGAGIDASLEVAAYASTEAGAGADTGIETTLYPLTDTGTALEAATVTPVYVQVDGAAGADVGVHTASYTATDAGVGVDVALVSVPKSATDSGSGSDAATQGASYSATDVPSVADSAAQSADYTRAETGAGAEASASAASLQLAEAGAGVEVISARSFGVTDTGVGADSATLQTDTSKVASDSASATESTTLQADAIAAQSGTGSEVVLQTAAASTTDIGAGAETAVGGAAQSGTDAGVWAEFSVETAATAVSETGTGFESSVLEAGMDWLRTDSGQGFDSSVLAVLALVSDDGQGTEVSGVTREGGSGRVIVMVPASPHVGSSVSVGVPATGHIGSGVLRMRKDWQ